MKKATSVGKHIKFTTGPNELKARVPYCSVHRVEIVRHKYTV